MPIIELLISLILGVIFGVLTGLIPGIHINLISVLVLVFAHNLLEIFTQNSLIVFLVSMGITHTFLDVIPAIFLGAPEENTALTTLPGHKLLMKGKGHLAIKLTIIGSLMGLIIILIISPIYFLLLPNYYLKIQNYIPLILIISTLILILKEKKKLLSFVLFCLSGTLGILTLNSVVINQPLLPLLSSLFGISLITTSIVKKVKIPKQKTDLKSKENLSKIILPSILSGSIVSFLPGLGSAQGAVFGRFFMKKSDKRFLILIGAISTITMGLGLATLYSINRSRHGIAIAISKIIETPIINQFYLVIASIFLSGCIAAIITIKISKVISNKINKLNYKRISILIIITIITLSIIISGKYSILILLTGTSIGILTEKLGIKKMYLMGCLIIPTIILLI